MPTKHLRCVPRFSVESLPFPIMSPRVSLPDLPFPSLYFVFGSPLPEISSFSHISSCRHMPPRFTAIGELRRLSTRSSTTPSPSLSHVLSGAFFPFAGASPQHRRCHSRSAASSFLLTASDCCRSPSLHLRHCTHHHLLSLFHHFAHSSVDTLVA